MGVDHGRTDAPMTEKLLNRPNVVAIFKEMRSECMPEGVTADRLA
jgi:hypothetical protein